MQHLNKFCFCYHECTKSVFDYSKFDSVTGLLLTLPSFNTIVHNTCLSFRNHLSTVDNIIMLVASE